MFIAAIICLCVAVACLIFAFCTRGFVGFWRLSINLLPSLVLGIVGVILLLLS